MHMKVVEDRRGERFHLRCRPSDTGTRFLLCVCALFLVIVPIGAVQRFQGGLSGEGWKILTAYPVVIAASVYMGYFVFWRSRWDLRLTRSGASLSRGLW